MHHFPFCITYEKQGSPPLHHLIHTYMYDNTTTTSWCMSAGFPRRRQLVRRFHVDINPICIVKDGRSWARVLCCSPRFAFISKRDRREKANKTPDHKPLPRQHIKDAGCARKSSTLHTHIYILLVVVILIIIFFLYNIYSGCLLCSNQTLIFPSSSAELSPSFIPNNTQFPHNHRTTRKKNTSKAPEIP